MPGKTHTLEIAVTEQAVNRFAELSGDYNPIHMDEAYCEARGLNGRIAHGMLVQSYLSQLLGMYLPGPGTLWLSQNMDFLLPVRIGDTLTIEGTVIHEDKNNALGLNILEIKVIIRNQHGQKAVRGKVKVCLK